MRLRNIQENLAFMASLNLSSAKKELKTAVGVKKVRDLIIRRWNRHYCLCIINILGIIQLITQCRVLNNSWPLAISDQFVKMADQTHFWLATLSDQAMKLSILICCPTNSLTIVGHGGQSKFVSCFELCNGNRVVRSVWSIV